MPKQVYIVDDNADVRALLVALLSSVSVPTRTFSSGVDFLREVNRSFEGCLMLDVRMPDMSGLEVCEHLRRRRLRLPVILMSAFADVPMVIRAMKAGAVDFVEKPFNAQDLLERVQTVLAQSEEAGEAAAGYAVDVLTARERQVLDRILAGKLNKEIAAELGIGQRTVETHRAKLMRKLGCKSVVELVRNMASVGRDAAP